MTRPNSRSLAALERGAEQALGNACDDLAMMKDAERRGYPDEAKKWAGYIADWIALVEAAWDFLDAARSRPVPKKRRAELELLREKAGLDA